jgi:hypothetical protein
MNETFAASAAAPTIHGASTSTGVAATRALLACGVVAGPLYVVTGLTQALSREGFDITRHSWSLLSNGAFGWIQIANFLLSGALVVACAVGLRRTLRSGRGTTWAPRLIGGFGVGLIAAGAFVADPMDGFPVGTPVGAAEHVSWHGVLHFVVAGLAFLSLVAACLVLARRFASLGRRGWAAYSAATGVVFLAAFFGLASGSTQAAVVLAFVVAIVLAWTWIAAVSALLRGEVR